MIDEVTATVIPAKYVKVTCVHCGSDKITHASRVICLYPVEKWTLAPNGMPVGDEFGSPKTLEETIENVEFPYDCRGCGRVEMTESDLAIDGVPYDPSAVEDEEEVPDGTDD